MMWFNRCINAISGGALYYCGGNYWEFVQMLEKQMIKLESMLVLVIDKVNWNAIWCLIAHLASFVWQMRLL